MSDLFAVIRTGDVSAVKEYIRSEGEEDALSTSLFAGYQVANTRNKEGNYPLHVSSRLGFCDVLWFLSLLIFQITHVLIKRKAKVTCLNKDGETPLHLAAKAGHLEVLEELLKTSQVRECVAHLHLPEC